MNLSVKKDNLTIRRDLYYLARFVACDNLSRLYLLPFYQELE